MTQKIDVDNRIALRNYYRIADNLLKQANIYRDEKNLIDLYVILLRYSSLVSETIPYHRNYQGLHPKEKKFFKKKLLGVLDELKILKPKVRRQLDELEKDKKANQMHRFDFHHSEPSVIYSDKQMIPASTSHLFSLKRNNTHSQVSSPNSVHSQFQKLAIS